MESEQATHVAPVDSPEREPTPTTCPRCKSSLGDAEFYGICASCSTNLRAVYSGESRDVKAAEYEPKMNVTPNAIASKE